VFYKCKKVKNVYKKWRFFGLIFDFFSPKIFFRAIIGVFFDPILTQFFRKAAL